MTFDRRQINLRALNSLTKYPSIPTYHELDPRTGCLIENPTIFYRDGYEKLDGPVIGTEKVDGTNARIILLPDGGYLLGSRENLLYASGDLIGDPSQGIAEHLRSVAEDLPPVDSGFDGNTLIVYFLELYGGKIGGQAKQYSTQGTVGWRLFDVAWIDQLDERLTWPRERISGWRESGGQSFIDEETLRTDAHLFEFELTPRLFRVDASELPTDIEGVHAFLGAQLPGTRVALDDSARGAAEGIVLRTPDRAVIAKARFQDYERTLRRRGGRA